MKVWRVGPDIAVNPHTVSSVQKGPKDGTVRVYFGRNDCATVYGTTVDKAVAEWNAALKDGTQ